MNYFEKLLYLLQGEMNTPTAFGWFHCLCLTLVIVIIIVLYKRRKHFCESQLKTVLGVYGITALILEILKQLIWTFNYDPITNIVTWDYEWYSFPFQLCTTPIFVCLICLFLKKGKIRDSLLSYISYVTILGSVATIIMPDSCFVSDILVNIHTTWLHYGSFVISIYLLIVGEVKLNIKNVKNSIIVFLIFVGIAEILNLVIYNLGILNGETFNMFYISPYFISDLPVFDMIQQIVPYIFYLLIYVWAIIIGSFVVYYISILINYIFTRIKQDN